MILAPIFVVFTSLLCSGQSQKLGTYNVDKSSVTVSGLSSGACFATQMHFIYSSLIKGAGVFAGVPFLCARSGSCALTEAIPAANVSSLVAMAQSYSDKGLIDPISNIAGSKLYGFHGTLDTTVNPSYGPVVEKMYQQLGAATKTQFTTASGHGQPVDTSNGGPCFLSNNLLTGGLNNCDLDGAYEALNFFYGGLLGKPSKTYVPTGSTLNFTQTEFLGSNSLLMANMASTGYIYVPKTCAPESGQLCKLHVAFHGCVQNAETVGMAYVQRSEYAAVADLNNIIILFPQTTNGLLNPMGCWDWFGYTSLTSYATKSGIQPNAVYQMIQRVMG